MAVLTKERDFMGRYRDQTLGIRLTQDEKEKILAHMEKAGFKNITDFFIYCTCNCRAFNFDLTPLLAVKNEMSRIGSNINQIAKVANTSKSVYRNDVLRLEDEVNELRKIVHKNFMTIKDAKENGLHED